MVSLRDEFTAAEVSAQRRMESYMRDRCSSLALFHRASSVTVATASTQSGTSACKRLSVHCRASASSSRVSMLLSGRTDCLFPTRALIFSTLASTEESNIVEQTFAVNGDTRSNARNDG